MIVATIGRKSALKTSNYYQECNNKVGMIDITKAIQVFVTMVDNGNLGLIEH